MFCENGFDECDYDPATDSDDAQRAIRIERFVERAKAHGSAEQFETMQDVYDKDGDMFEILVLAVAYSNTDDLEEKRCELREWLESKAIETARRVIK